MTKDSIFKLFEDVCYWIPEEHIPLKRSNLPPSESYTVFNQLFFGESSFYFKIKGFIQLDKLPKYYEFLSEHGFNYFNTSVVDEKFCFDIASRDMGMLISQTVKREMDVDSFQYLPSNVNDRYIGITIIPWAKNKERIKKFISDFFDLDIHEKVKNDKNKFYMVKSSKNGLSKIETSCDPQEIKDDKFDLYYGKNFPHDKFKSFITEKTDNLLLLHGDPGTGKSNYLKHLIKNCGKNVIYVPPSMVQLISDPSFVSFMLENKNSILLIEDAEEILSTERNSATNNLLGICDGFLKDAMNLKVICTFNCDLKKIDPALLRKGRLFFEYKFDKLTKEEGQELSDYLNLGLDVREDMTLSEIFNHEKSVSNGESFKNRMIGFST